jgi:hypothetical protein
MLDTVFLGHGGHGLSCQYGFSCCNLWSLWVLAAKGMLHGMNVSSECAGESSLRGIYHLPCTKAIMNLAHSISV